MFKVTYLCVDHVPFLFLCLTVGSLCLLNSAECSPSWKAIGFVANSYEVLKPGFLFQHSNFALIQPQQSVANCSPLSPLETRLQHLFSATHLEVLWYCGRNCSCRNCTSAAMVSPSHVAYEFCCLLLVM